MDLGNAVHLSHTVFSISALGQIMLYIDGMEGVIKHNDTVRWLYSLIASSVSLYLSLINIVAVIVY